MQNQEIAKYSDRFRQHAVLRMAFSVITVICVAVVLFVPMFEVDLLIVTEWFSLFDEIALSFKSFHSGSVFLYVGIAFLILSAVMLFVYIISTYMKLSGNKDDFAMKCYDKIKKSNSGALRAKVERDAYFIFTFALYAGIMCTVMGMIFGAAFNFGKDADSYFAICTGVNWLLMFGIIMILGCIASGVYAKMYYNKIETDMMRTEYEAEAAEASAQKEVAADGANDKAE